MKPGIVYLIGAGPGDPGLLTIKGRDCLRRAQVVVYDRLANPALLAEAPPGAERISVGKSSGCHNSPQEEINRLLADKAAAGLIVVRLKGGDPFVFGRGGEEALFLRRRGIPFEIVPGVTAGFAAAAYAGIPLTHRDFTASLGLLSGHQGSGAGLADLDWAGLASAAGTLVVYMGVSNLPLIAGELVAHGRPPQTPVAVIRWATTPRQQTVTGTLADIAEKVAAAGLKPPAVIVIGEVVGLREELRWFDNRPLFGRTVLVTRAADQAGEFTALLEARGARVIECPTICLEPAESAELDQTMATLAGYDWLVLTSANAVAFFFARLRQRGRDARAIGACRVCAVGPKTAAALAAHGIAADLVPADYKGEGVVAAFAALDLEGARVLFPRADKARDVIPEGLAALGARVDAPVLYRNVAPEALPAPALAALEAGEVDCVAFTASSTAENLAAILGAERFKRLLAGVAVAAIGPIAAKTCRRLGLEVSVEPEVYTLEALTDALAGHFAGRQR